MSFDGEILNIRKLLIQYKIKDGDILQLIKSKGIIDVFLDYKINKMLVKVDLEETILEFLKFISVFFNVKYSLIECVIKGKMINSKKAFYQLNVESNERIIIIKRMLGG